VTITQQEQEILDKIKDAETEQKEARTLVAFHKKAAIDAETRLIAANLTLEGLKENLRVYLLKYPHYEETYNEKDIREFRERLPELLKTIK
jgi:hypothetical protein